jgi:hypothetical protein
MRTWQRDLDRGVTTELTNRIRANDVTEVATTIVPAKLMACCNACHRNVRVRVEVRTNTFRVVVCGACAVAMAARFRMLGESLRVVDMVSRKVNPWTVSDGRYFARDVDATEQQKTINEAERRYANRVRRVIARAAEQARRVA